MYASKLSLPVALFLVACGGAAPSEIDSQNTPVEARTEALYTQHRDANAHQWWTLPGAAWNVDQIIVPKTVPNNTYFAHTFFFQHNPNGDDGAYMGLQQGASPSARQARFSIWNATAASGSSCTNFGGEGLGKTCTVPYAFVVDRQYTLRIWRLSADASGTWWGAWVIDRTTGVETHIGSIRAPNGVGDIATTDSFDEYFGEARPCNAVPTSMVLFGAPWINGNTAHASYGGTSVGSCSGGRVTQTIYGVSVLELGH